MRKIIVTIFIIVLVLFVVDWGMLGLKIVNGNYDIFNEILIGAFCFILIFICIFYKIFSMYKNEH